MSSEHWEESGSKGRAKEKQQEEVAENKEVEVPCEDCQAAGSPRLEQGPGEWLFSPDHCGMQDVTSEGGLERVQKEERQEKEGTSPNVIIKQERRPGGRLVKRHRRRSFLRGLPTSLYPNREGRAEEPHSAGPLFFFGGTNGAAIVSGYCESRGWKRIYNKHREDFKLKWCEMKSPASYYNFREGEQLVFQIPNNTVLTTKIGLLSSLREYERVSSKVRHGQGLRRLKMEDFIPTTFRLDLRAEREAFFAQQEGMSNNESQMWICKPTGLNQGKGIFLMKGPEDVDAFRLKLHHMEDGQTSRTAHHRQPQARIVQHYIQRPLLLKGKKFDVRSYLLIACTAPHMVFFRHGYVRLTCDLYDPSSNNLSAHLTNQYMQKKNPLYSQLKEDTVWSMETFNTYVNDRHQVAKGLPRDWVLGVFARRMQQIMTQCFHAVKSKLDSRLGFFDLIGCDFLVDEDFKVWLLEMNCNPALHTNCEVLKDVIPSTVEEALDLTLEIFNKCRLKQKILSLSSQKDFVLLYSGVYPYDPLMGCNKTNTNSEFRQNGTKNSHQTGQRCNMGSGVKTEPSPSTECFADAAASRKERVGFRPTTSTTASPAHPNPLSVQPARNKTYTHRVELKLGKCTLHPHLKVSTEKTRVVMSPESLVPRGGISMVSGPPHAASPVCEKQQTGEDSGDDLRTEHSRLSS
ncbi:protein polyglycylase TTLL10 [Antennarius striatus]|uniref:protein polyglycylase TTLL10 n=1 Tax=Antennarius striatus TaxID=241820 RepID=UPI0035AE246A